MKIWPQPLPVPHAEYHLDLSPMASRELIIRSAEEFSYASRFLFEKDFSRRFWVKFYNGRPNLQVKPLNRKRYTVWYSALSPWFGIGIYETSFGSNVEVITHYNPFAIGMDVFNLLILVLFFIFSLVVNIFSVITSGVVLGNLGFLVFIIIFGALNLFIRRERVKTAETDIEEMKEFLDILFGPYLHKYRIPE